MVETLGKRRFGEGREPRTRIDPGRSLARLLDVVSATHARALAFLIVCGFLFFLPGVFHIPPIDRDEARFAQATKQMVETGDLVDIRFQNEVRYKKPVGIYWLQAATVQTASALGIPNAQIRIWIYRIPSVIGAIGAVLLTYWTALAFVSRRTAVIAALLMCGSLLLGVEARLAKTDAVLLLTVVAAMGALAKAYLPWQRGEEDDRSWTLPFVFWTALAGGFLLKGPLILMFVALTVGTLAIFDRSVAWLKRLRPAWGLLWMLVLVLPWFVAILLKAGQTFIADSVSGDMLSKITSGQESHGAPPGLYFLLFWVTFWPGAPLAGLAAPAAWRARREPAVQFLLAWIIPSWIVFELVMTKLPHYVLPLYPAIAILTVLVLERGKLSLSPWLQRGAAWWFVIPVLLSASAIIGVMMLTLQPTFLAWPFAAGALIFGLFAWWLYDDVRAEQSVLCSVAASLFLSVTLLGIVVPSLAPLFPSVEVARALRNVECVKPQSAAAGFHEPSLVFMTGTSTLLTDGSGAADFLGKGSCRFALVEARQERTFAQRAEAIGLRYEIAKRIEGYNFSQGRQISIAIFRNLGTR
ncbi:MAG TPA: glycosyltransferase family 39 protein [Xanthobacteraceae bacterium]|nr:glycosyltransferase family 39 protein [Xanthobacteraceae bacterium]